jgi:phosphatidylserine decarboxylase
LSASDNKGYLLAPDGVLLVSGMLGAGLVSVFFAWTLSPWFWCLAAPVLVLGLFLGWFFRDPVRTPPGGINDLVSPADGRVLTAEAGFFDERFLNETVTRISIFMSPVDVHVNRNPLDGEVEAVHYNPGRYFAAYSHKASLDNEQNAIVMKVREGRRLAYVQIAGFLARRIVCHLGIGDQCVRGERMGMIKLGSRVDVFVPGTFRLDVQPGDRVCAGETILGHLE